jgi:phosphatidylserine/phosphatidylglycerophosphate/cardiolipin synthase-like enzyme
MKIFDIDNGQKMTIGSMNQDNWSFKVNNEANVLITNLKEDSTDRHSY